MSVSQSCGEHPMILVHYLKQSGQELKLGLEKLIDTARKIRQRQIPDIESMQNLDNYLHYFGKCLSRAIYYHHIKTGGPWF